MKTTLLVVSFGTTHLDTLEKTIAATENALAAAFPEYPLYRAFTSGIVRKRLKSKFDIHVDSMEEAMTRIAGDGFEQVIVQPTLLIPGEEYDKLCAAIEASAGNMKICIGKPLLCGEPDLDSIIRVLQEAYPVDGDTILLLMGHGTEHTANDIYIRLAQKMRKLPMRLCTVEGTPSFDDAIEELTALPQRKIRLAPMLFVAGDHAKNDMAGDEPDSLRSMLEEKDFAVECKIQGLGELQAIRNMYVQKAAKAIK